MTRLKLILMTAATVALPFAASAQISTDAMTDQVKTKAVDTVLDNMTTDDAITAGKVMIKGGSKEDAARAVVKDRIETKVDAMVGEKTGDLISTDNISRDDMMTVGQEMAKQKMLDTAAGSAKTYKDKAGSAMTDKAESVLSDNAKSTATTFGGDMIKTDMSDTEVTAPTLSAPLGTTSISQSLPPVACPTGTVPQPNGTCMLTE